MKNWKSLFVKSNEEEQENIAPKEQLSFPVSRNDDGAEYVQPSPTQPIVSNPAINEVMKVYENGLESINMPGYDFYEFYMAIISTGAAGEQTYNMAFQMAKSMDKTITVQKLVNDAEFYISKINEVYNDYVSQGQQKLNSLQEQKNMERNKLSAEIEQSSARIQQLKAELKQLETQLNQQKNDLNKIDQSIYPKEKAIREKLLANDMAKKNSIDKLSMIKEGLQRFIK